MIRQFLNSVSLYPSCRENSNTISNTISHGEVYLFKVSPLIKCFEQVCKINVLIFISFGDFVLKNNFCQVLANCKLCKDVNNNNITIFHAIHTTT